MADEIASDFSLYSSDVMTFVWSYYSSALMALVWFSEVSSSDSTKLSDMIFVVTSDDGFSTNERVFVYSSRTTDLISSYSSFDSLSDSS